MMEKLVEEIAKAIWATDPIYYNFLAEDTKRLAKRLITRIGKAYADGELELPGEVGRRSTKGTSWDWTVWIDNARLNYNADILIALRKEEEK